MTAVVSILGAGGLTAIVTAWLKARVARDKAAASDKHDILGMLHTRLGIVETKLDECLRLRFEQERQIGRLEQEVGWLRDKGTKTNALVVVDQSGSIVDWNTAAARMFHWSRDQVLGKNVALLTPPRHRGAHLTAFKAAAEKQAILRGKEFPEMQAITANGVLITVRITLESWLEEGKWLCAAEISEL